jgi:Holliday junction resolvase
MVDKHKPKPKHKKLKAKHKGCHSELTGAAWLLENGYDVFRNVSSHGVIDLIGIRHGVVEFFDCKSVGNSGGLSIEAKDLGVKRLIVNGDGKIKNTIH